MRNAAREFRQAGAVHELLAPFCFATGDGMVLAKNGDLCLAFRLEGMDYQCRNPEELDRAARRFEAALRGLPANIRVYQYVLKRCQKVLPRGSYDNPVLEQAIGQRLAWMEQRGEVLYQLETYAVLCLERWQPAGRRLAPRSTAVLLESKLVEAAELLSRRAQIFQAQLADVFALAPLDREETFRLLARLANPDPVKAACLPLREDRPLDVQLAASAIDCYRAHLRIDDYFVQALALKEMPARTSAHLFRDLFEIQANLHVVLEWRREDAERARRILQMKRRHYHNQKFSIWSYLSTREVANPEDLLLDDSARAHVQQLGACLEAIEVEGQTLGEFALTVLVLDPEQERVRAAAAEVMKVFAAYDATVLDERYNLLNAWRAAIPGNRQASLRRQWVLSPNAADLSFLFTLRNGEIRNAHLDAEYLALLETNHGTPFYLNLHYQDVAHTLILGATGSGKSFLLNFLLTNAQKYQPLTLIFDLAGGYEHLAEWFGGSHLRFGLEMGGVKLNPFTLEPTAANLHFLTAFVRTLLETGNPPLGAAEEADLHRQIEALYAIDPSLRRLLSLSMILPKPLRERLAPWVEGGQYGAAFDSVEDTLKLQHFQCIDLLDMDRYPAILEPLLFYILHRASALIYDPARQTGLKLVVMDEAWRFLRNQTIRRYVTEAVKTWRKHNAAILLATQSSDDLARSEIFPVLLESCPTKIFLANPGMDRAHYRETFHLNETEVAQIEQLIPKRQFLLKRPDLSTVLNLNVDPVGYWLYTNSPFDNQRRKEALGAHGFREGLRVLAEEGNR